MATPCALVPATDQFASGLLAFLDCQAANLGAQGYAALAAPGSTAAGVLAVALTIVVALFGYRMLFGDTPSMRDGVLAVIKVGVVLAFATSWPAYQTVIYSVVLRAPSQIAAEIAAPSGIPGTQGDLPARLDGVDQAFRQLAIAGVGFPTVNAGDERLEPPLWAGFETFALGASRFVFLTGAITAFSVVRLIAGLLLALGPLFLIFLLFDATRGLFEGWVRGLLTSAFGALATTIVLGIELAVLEPWLAHLLALRAANYSIAGIPGALLATTFVFAITAAALLFATMRLASGLSLSRLTTIVIAQREGGRRDAISNRTATSSQQSHTIPIEGRSRAAAISDAIATAEQREQRLVGQAGGGRFVPNSASQAEGLSLPSLGSSVRRRTTSRVSASARKRDRRS